MRGMAFCPAHVTGFFKAELDDKNGLANIQLEPNVKIVKKDIDIFGEDFESTKDGFVDFLLLDDKGFPGRSTRLW